ncbi:hypothetical protein NDU88_002606 [Pleurodeles waltl]|uniref:Uncharacterized protein n=1 Tax=Pleurodeles waltl TaxID=8319 RepID=A0AAV7M6H4_PLEWA|nr:hypothetical protein NDU88_002606 [Pleurodeles waltl]
MPPAARAADLESGWRRRGACGAGGHQNAWQPTAYRSGPEGRVVAPPSAASRVMVARPDPWGGPMCAECRSWR